MRGKPGVMAANLEASMVSSDLTVTVSSGLAEEVTLSRFQQQVLMLVSERDSQEKHLSDLSRRLQESQDEMSAARHHATEMQVQLREAQRKQGEAVQQVALQERALEDECKRQKLALRLANEKAAESQQQVQQQGQQIHTLTEQVRAHENEVARLRIEKDGTSDLILTFQARLEDVSKVVSRTAQSEQLCKLALKNARDDHAAIARQLAACQAVQRGQTPIEQLQRGLHETQCKVSELTEGIQKSEQALRAKQREVTTLSEQCTSWHQELHAAGQHAVQQHEVAMQSEAKAEQLVDTLQRVRQVDHSPCMTTAARTSARHPASPSVERTLSQRSLMLVEANQQLTQRLSWSSTVNQLLLRELTTADASVFSAQLSAQLDKRSASTLVEAANARVEALTLLLRSVASEIDTVTERTCEQAARNTALEQELADERQKQNNGALSMDATQLSSLSRPASATAIAAVAPEKPTPATTATRESAPFNTAAPSTPHMETLVGMVLQSTPATQGGDQARALPGTAARVSPAVLSEQALADSTPANAGCVTQAPPPEQALADSTPATRPGQPALDCATGHVSLTFPPEQTLDGSVTRHDPTSVGLANVGLARGGLATPSVLQTHARGVDAQLLHRSACAASASACSTDHLGELDQASRGGASDAIFGTPLQGLGATRPATDVFEVHLLTPLVAKGPSSGPLLFTDGIPPFSSNDFGIPLPSNGPSVAPCLEVESQTQPSAGGSIAQNAQLLCAHPQCSDTIIYGAFAKCSKCSSVFHAKCCGRTSQASCETNSPHG